MYVCVSAKVKATTIRKLGHFLLQSRTRAKSEKQQAKVKAKVSK